MGIEDWTRAKIPPVMAAIWDSRTEAFARGPLTAIVSDNDIYEDNGERWRHVSFSRKDRLPSWEEARMVRDDFFPEDACVVNVFPPSSEYRNLHPYCLHLWWNKDRRIVPKETADAVAPGGLRICP